jgi:hypothetical protein
MSYQWETLEEPKKFFPRRPFVGKAKGEMTTILVPLYRVSSITARMCNDNIKNYV